MVSLSKCLIYFLSGQLKYLLSSCSPQKRQLTSSLVLLTLKLPVPSNDNATQRRRKFWRSFLRRSCSKHWNSGTFFEGFMFMLDHTHTTVWLIDLGFTFILKLMWHQGAKLFLVYWTSFLCFYVSLYLFWIKHGQCLAADNANGIKIEHAQFYTWSENPLVIYGKLGCILMMR